MTVNFIFFASSMHDQETVRAAHESLLSQLESEFTIRYVAPQDIGSLSPEDYSVLFIATGGTENIVAQYFEQLPHPPVLVADGLHNSLAAALEISTWIRQQGVNSEILHGKTSYISQRLQLLYRLHQAQQSLSGRRIGVIGAPSSWLIASNVDYLLAKTRWGISYIDIPLEEVSRRYMTITNDEVRERSEDLFRRTQGIVEDRTLEDVCQAMRMYRAIRQVCDENQLDALTVSCFKLIEMTGTTGCLALSLLNDEGIIAGCEGDLQSVFTMLVVKTLTGKDSFMANPSAIDQATNEMTLAHCTVGLRQTQQFILRSHFESGKGIGIQGLLPENVPVTLVKCGGVALDEYFVADATLLENTNHFNLCRTQVRVKMQQPVDYFLNNPLGNHHILVQGEYGTLLNTFFHANACKRIK
ncbi:MAG: fucose isomerase [Prevotellaceae bacterium]|jgi:L-fucose isomerase-like protein|nr:fucose isomerase [Prevotellaceae bacterium]